MTTRDATAKRTLAKIEKLARSVVRDIQKKQNPRIEIPLRTLSNIHYSAKKKIIEMGKETQERSFFNVSQARKFMQTFLVATACKELLESGKTTSIRDLYYMTKHTLGNTRQNTFEEQDESDPIIEDLEVTLDALREELHLFANRKGLMEGPMTIIDSGDRDPGVGASPRSWSRT